MIPIVRSNMRRTALWMPSILLVMMTSNVATAFVVPRIVSTTNTTTTSTTANLPSQLRLTMASIRIATPTPDEAVDMGIREWPQQQQQQQKQKQKGEWTEFVPEGKSVTRYILEGSGTVEITDQESATMKTVEWTPGTLVEVTGTASLSWKVTKNTTAGAEDDRQDDVIILTPDFEQGGLLLGVAAAVIVILGALLAGF